MISKILFCDIKNTDFIVKRRLIDRIIGLQIEISPSFYVYVFQTYFPCSNHPIAEFLGYIDKLENLLGLYADKGLVAIMGDLNANLLHSQSVSMQNNRSRALIDFYPVITWFP